MLRRLLTNWLVSSPTLLMHGVGDARASGPRGYPVRPRSPARGHSASDPVHDFEPRLTLGDHPLKLLCADDPHHGMPDFSTSTRTLPPWTSFMISPRWVRASRAGTVLILTDADVRPSVLIRTK